MNICLRHKKHPKNEKNRNSTYKQAKEDLNDISNKYFLCKSCGVLIDENEDNILMKSHLKNFTPLKEMDLLDMISFFVNQQDTKKIQISSPDNPKSSNNSLIKKYIAERTDLIQYLTRMVKQFKYTEKTFYYTISIFDSIFSLIESQNLRFYDLKVDVILISSLLIAVKYSENDPRLPDYKDLFTRNSRVYFSERDLRNTEIICLKILNYNLNFINVFDYIDFFLMLGIVDKKDMDYNLDALEKINNQVLFLTNAFISESKSLIFTDLQIACSIVKLVRELNKFQNKWLNVYKELFFIEDVYFTECFETLKSTILKKKSFSNCNIISGSKNLYSSMNNINSILNTKTPTNSDAYYSKNQINTSNNFFTYTANNYSCSQNRYDFSTRNPQKYSSLLNKKINLNNDLDTENIIKKYSGDVKEEELMKILGNNKENLNSISNIQADEDKNPHLNMITDNSDKEIVENLLNNNQDSNGNNLKSVPENSSKAKDVQYNYNYVNEKNIFKKSELLIKKNSISQKSNTNKFEYSSNTFKPRNYKGMKDDTINKNNYLNQDKKLFENVDEKLLNKDNIAKITNKQDNLINPNKFSLTDFNKTLNKKNRHSLTSHPSFLNDILSKINLLENIEEKMLSQRELNENRKSLEKIEEIQTFQTQTFSKNSLKKSITTKNSMNKSSNNYLNKLNKLIQTKDFKSEKINKNSNPIIKRNENTFSKKKKLDFKRTSEPSVINSNGFKTFHNSNEHLKKFSILNSLSNSDSFTNTSLNFSSNPDSRRIKNNQEEDNKPQANKKQVNKIDQKNELGIIDENNKIQSFYLSASIIPKNDKGEKNENPLEPINQKEKVETNSSKKDLNNNSSNSNKKRNNDKKLNFDKKISNLRDEINNRLKEINGITLDLNKNKESEEDNLEFNNSRILDLAKNLEAISKLREKKDPNLDKSAKDFFGSGNNFNHIFETNIKQLEEKFASFKKKIRVQNGNLVNKNDPSDKNFHSTFENNLNLKIEDKKFDTEDNVNLGKSSLVSSDSKNKKESQIQREHNEDIFYDDDLYLNNFENEEAIEDALKLKSINNSSGELEKNINKITNYFKKNSLINCDKNRRNHSIKQINTDISNFEMDMFNTQNNNNNMLENLDTLKDLDILKTEVPSLNKHQILSKKKFPIGNDITLQNIEHSLEKLTSLRKEKKLKSKNLILDISEDLKTKSKKLRTEMEKISRILETEIIESNNNISGNNTSTSFSKVKSFKNNLNTQTKYKKDNLNIKSVNDNNSDAKHFKKITYDPKSTKKFSFFKNSPNKTENNLDEKLVDLSKPKLYNKAKTNKSQIENNGKLIKDKPNLNHFSKNHRIKDIRNEININQLDSMTLSDIGKSVSNYNRCVTMKSESKIKNYYLDLMRNNNNKVIDQFRTNKSTTRQKILNDKSDNLNNINDFSNRNNILGNDFAKFSSIEPKNDFLSIENPNNDKSPFFNIFDSKNSTSKIVKNIFKASDNKITHKDSEVTINSMSISSSNNNLKNLVFKNNNLNSNNNMSIIENNNLLELNSEDNKKNDLNNHENYFKTKSNSNNIFEHLSKEKTRRANIESNKEIFNVQSNNRNNCVNNISKSISDFDFAFANARKMKIDETERVQNKLNLINNLNSNGGSAVTDRNHFFNNLRNKKINQLNENALVSSVSSMGGLKTIDPNQTIFNNFLNENEKKDFSNNGNQNKEQNQNNNSNNNDTNTNNKNLFDLTNDNFIKLKVEKEHSEIKNENKKSIIDENILKNLISSNYNPSNNLSTSAKKKNNLAKFSNSNNFKYLNDLLNVQNNYTTKNYNNFKADNEKSYGFFSAEKNKLSHLNSDLYLKTGKPNGPTFDFISGLNTNKNGKTSIKDNSMNPALKKINDLKNELSHYTNSTNTNKKQNSNLIGNLNTNNFLSANNIDLRNLISNTTSNGQVANSNFNFNFNFFNGPNINPHQHPLQNISYNYLANLGNLENNSYNNSNLNSNDNNLNLLMRLLENKTANNSNNNNLKLGNLKNSSSSLNKYKFLNLNNLTSNNDLNTVINNNNNFNLNSNKIKNQNLQKSANKNSLNNVLDYPITTKNKNINYFNFDDNSKKRTNKK